MSPRHLVMFPLALPHLRTISLRLLVKVPFLFLLFQRTFSLPIPLQMYVPM